eukprot:TRINITY_DN43291_c0_g1_i2.p1 TRINITY_DN43291_c0_g1~~TRINITY_DN43291_c0_g1_i2.p1  ORF type:complete len:101 (-),score=12.49 TRINITY_DN43291_c0_g1_i2:3-305(-)
MTLAMEAAASAGVTKQEHQLDGESCAEQWASIVPQLRKRADATRNVMLGAGFHSTVLVVQMLLCKIVLCECDAKVTRIGVALDGEPTNRRPEGHIGKDCA